MKSNPQHINFATEVKQFIISSCRQRLMLLALGKSKSNNPHLYDIAQGLKSDCDRIYTDYQAALFLKRKASEIIALLPGDKCAGIKKRIDQLNQLNYKSNTILSC